MIPNSEQLEAIAAKREGSLAEVPFAILLHAHRMQRSSVRLELQRKIVSKEVIILDGVPVECRSNLAHESLDRFLLGAGMLDEDTVNSLRAMVLAEGIDFAEAVLRRGLLTPDELVRQQQTNLAKKLLDGFSWSDGSFSTSSDLGPLGARLRVNLLQLIVFGITRFTPQAVIDAVLVDLVGERHGLNPAPAYDLDDLKLSPPQQTVIESLRDGPRDLEEVAVASGLKLDDFTRFVYAMAVTGIILREAVIGQEPSAPAGAQPGVVAEETAGIALPAPSQAMCAELVERAKAVRHRLPSEVLQIGADAPPQIVDEEFLSFIQRYSPWRYEQTLHEAARELFFAGVEAYCRLTVQHRHETGSRLASVDAPAQQPSKAVELVDPAVQYAEGLELKADGDYAGALELLEAAAELDPQNPEYRSEVAHCSFLIAPDEHAREAMGELTEILRVEPACGLAHFYLGQIHERQGHRERAAECYRTANTQLAPDRRAIEALMRLTARFGTA